MAWKRATLLILKKRYWWKGPLRAMQKDGMPETHARIMRSDLRDFAEEFMNVSPQKVFETDRHGTSIRCLYNWANMARSVMDDSARYAWMDQATCTPEKAERHWTQIAGPVLDAVRDVDSAYAKFMKPFTDIGMPPDLRNNVVSIVDACRYLTYHGAEYALKTMPPRRRALKWNSVKKDVLSVANWNPPEPHTYGDLLAALNKDVFRLFEGPFVAAFAPNQLREGHDTWIFCKLVLPNYTGMLRSHVRVLWNRDKDTGMLSVRCMAFDNYIDDKHHLPRQCGLLIEDIEREVEIVFLNHQKIWPGKDLWWPDETIRLTQGHPDCCGSALVVPSPPLID